VVGGVVGGTVVLLPSGVVLGARLDVDGVTVVG
jgi:hypothetical protein